MIAILVNESGDRVRPLRYADLMLDSTHIEQTVLTVSELNRQAKRCLTDGIGMVTLVGEVSNFSSPRSGHWYFSLKDEHAQLRCAWFASSRSPSMLPLQDGQQLLVYGQVGIYETRGDYQMVVQLGQVEGSGALAQAFFALKERLSQQGLFATWRKQVLPRIPGKIGLITSSSAAALQDMLTVHQRRCAWIPCKLYPAAVQGAQAADGLCAALDQAVAEGQCSVIIIARGGGSLEDLWCFNDEALAQRIYDCPIPIVTGIGHETDTTIADYVADVRAPTPSAAMELVCPDAQELSASLNVLFQRMQQAQRQTLQRMHQWVATLHAKMHHPRDKLQRHMQDCDHWQYRIRQSAVAMLRSEQLRCDNLWTRLQAVDPEQLLKRGYACVFTESEQVLSASQLQPNDECVLQWHDGRMKIRVISRL